MKQNTTAQKPGRKLAVHIQTLRALSAIDDATLRCAADVVAPSQVGRC